MNTGSAFFEIGMHVNTFNFLRLAKGKPKTGSHDMWIFQVNNGKVAIISTCVGSIVGRVEFSVDDCAGSDFSFTVDMSMVDDTLLADNGMVSIRLESSKLFIGENELKIRVTPLWQLFPIAFKDDADDKKVNLSVSVLSRVSKAVKALKVKGLNTDCLQYQAGTTANGKNEVAYFKLPLYGVEIIALPFIIPKH